MLFKFGTLNDIVELQKIQFEKFPKVQSRDQNWHFPAKNDI